MALAFRRECRVIGAIDRAHLVWSLAPVTTLVRPRRPTEKMTSGFHGFEVQVNGSGSMTSPNIPAGRMHRKFSGAHGPPPPNPQGPGSASHALESPRWREVIAVDQRGMGPDGPANDQVACNEAGDLVALENRRFGVHHDSKKSAS
jgi:hypothetical protein